MANCYWSRYLPDHFLNCVALLKRPGNWAYGTPRNFETLETSPLMKPLSVGTMTETDST